MSTNYYRPSNNAVRYTNYYAPYNNAVRSTNYYGPSNEAVRPTDYHLLSDSELQRQEVKHRQKYNGKISTIPISVGFGVKSLVATGGLAAPLVAAGIGYKLYKIHSHHKKHDAITAELAARHVSPQPKKKRDIVIPFVTSATSSVAMHGMLGGLQDTFVQ